jgi:hypothetical protein
MTQFMCGNDSQNRCLTSPAAAVQLCDWIIKDITEDSRAILTEEGDAVNVGLQCPSVMLNVQDEMAAVYRLYAFLTPQLTLRETVFPNNRQTCLVVDLRCHLLGKEDGGVINASVIEDRNEHLWPLFDGPRIEHEGQSDKS